jgi:hypothetical protein
VGHGAQVKSFDYVRRPSVGSRGLTAAEPRSQIVGVNSFTLLLFVFGSGWAVLASHTGWNILLLLLSGFQDLRVGHSLAC